MDKEITTINELPTSIIKNAIGMAKMLRSIISQKKNKVVVNGKIYLTFEDWQMLGRFMGLTVKTKSNGVEQMGDVLVASAEATILNKEGVIIGGATGICSTDEKKVNKKTGEIIYPWRDKPVAQLVSMAQTRAGAKALRNVLGWVATLADFEPTPAEEVVGETTTTKKKKITQKQYAKIMALIKEKDIPEEVVQSLLREKYKKEKISELSLGEANNLIKVLSEA